MGGSSYFFLIDEQEIYYGRPVVAIQTPSVEFGFFSIGYLLDGHPN